MSKLRRHQNDTLTSHDHHHAKMKRFPPPDPPSFHLALTCFVPTPLQESSPGEADSFHSRLIDEPAAPITCALVDKGTGQQVIRVEDLLHDILLTATGRDESD